MRLILPERLETERLVLRPCQARDYPAYAQFMSDERATRHLIFTPEQRTAEGSRRLFDEVLASYQRATPNFVLAICTKDDDAFIGSCGLYPTSPDEAECYYAIVPAHWGKGYATEAARELLRYAFGTLSAGRIVAKVSEQNPASELVAKKIGMKLDNKIRPEDWRDEDRRFMIDAETFENEA